GGGWRRRVLFGRGCARRHRLVGAALLRRLLRDLAVRLPVGLGARLVAASRFRRLARDGVEREQAGRGARDRATTLGRGEELLHEARDVGGARFAPRAQGGLTERGLE